MAKTSKRWPYLESAAQMLKVLEASRAYLAHELKNALGPVQILADVLHEEATSRALTNEKACALSERILDQSRIAYEVLNGYVDYAAPLRPKLCEADVNELLTATCDDWSDVFREKAIQLSTSWGDVERARVDERLLQRAAENLLQNAVEAMPQGGRLELRTWQAGRMLHFAIRDSGGGIREDDLPRLFELGFTTKPGRHGAGLGLALAYRAVTEAHQGRISAENNVDGPGATFTVEIPIRKEAPPDG